MWLWNRPSRWRDRPFRGSGLRNGRAVHVRREGPADLAERCPAPIVRPVLQLVRQDDAHVDVLGEAVQQVAVHAQAGGAVERQRRVWVTEARPRPERFLDDQVLLGTGIGVAAVIGGETELNLPPRGRLMHGGHSQQPRFVRLSARGLEHGLDAVLDDQPAEGPVDTPHAAAVLEVPVGDLRCREDLVAQLGEDLGDDIEQLGRGARVDHRCRRAAACGRRSASSAGVRQVTTTYG